MYVEGRLSTRSWTGQDGVQKSTTEIVIDDMIILDSRRDGASASSDTDMSYGEPDEAPAHEVEEKPAKKEKKVKEEKQDFEDVNPDDIPF